MLVADTFAGLLLPTNLEKRMNPLAILAGKLILKKVAKEFEKKELANPDVKTVQLGEAVYYKEADKAKGAIWAVLITGLTIASQLGWISPEIATALIELFSNENVQQAIENGAESL